MTWDTTTPSGSDSTRKGDDVIRQLKTDLQTALQAHGEFPVAAGSPEYVPRGQFGVTGSQPAASDGAFYYNTTDGALQWSDATTWHTLTVPSGSLMLFFQAAAPVGWTKNTSHNEQMVRVVSGTGGGELGFGGTISGSLSHVHGVGTLKFQVADFVWDEGAVSMTDIWFFSSGGSNRGTVTIPGSITANTVGGNVSVISGSVSGSDTETFTKGGTGSSAAGLAAIAKTIDMIICEKD